ncbi:MAG: ABC transporter ATP-binding protein [Anaerolineales bacterium]|nr:MAG: ABC transporter ATP-binding protein [Anaerolineales bacterium]
MSAQKLIRYIKPYWHWALLAPLMMLLEVAMDLLQPRLIQRIIDIGIAQRDMAIVITTGLTMIGLALVGAVGGTACTVFSVYAGQGFGADLRESLFRKVQSLSFSNLDALETGQLVTRLTNDVTVVQEAVMMLLRIMVRAPLMLIGSLVMAIITGPKLAPLFIILLPMVLLVVTFLIVKAFPLYSKVQANLDNLNTIMQENLMGVRVVKAFVRSSHESKRFGKSNQDLMDLAVKAARVVALGMPFMMLIVNLGVAGVLWFGAIQVNTGSMRVGQIIAFVNYLMNTLMSLMMLSMLTMNISRAEASSKRIVEVLERETTIVDRPHAMKDFIAQGRVAFENVTFSYDGEKHDAVLKNVTFEAEPGQTVAILGATGSGKSSLVQLIPRFYDVSKGRLTLDGVDVRDVEKAALRRNVGIALQEPVLFSGSVRDNIRYGRPEATDEEVIAAARMAQANNFIESCPNGYDTLLGQRGVNLSGGQKQRIAIARALLVNPAVLILDDSTSSVDVETETAIQAALDTFMDNRTCFIIAQRISTVLNADKILVLDGGEIAAQGSHDDLMLSSSIYREIYDSQLGNGVTAL